jgi:hypothetical protein
MFIGFPCVLPAQNIATLEGVYHTNHQSLGYFLPVFTSTISVVPDLFAYVSQRTKKLFTHAEGRFVVSASIFQIK